VEVIAAGAGTEVLGIVGGNEVVGVAKVLVSIVEGVNDDRVAVELLVAPEEVVEETVALVMLMN
jgi:hypothetical protein